MVSVTRLFSSGLADVSDSMNRVSEAGQVPIQVLLVSPRLPATDPRRCGDHAYTDTLLEYPPPGVRFHHYEDLIARSQARRLRFWRAAGYRLTQMGVLPPDTWAEYLAVDQTPDLIHIVALAAAVRVPSAQRVPVILHAASPSITDLTVKRDWTRRQVDKAYARKRLFLQLARAHHYALNSGAAGRVLVQTQFGRRLLASYGETPADKIEVLYPAQPVRQGALVPRAQRSASVTFLFVGSDFERKNGRMVLEAFRQVHTECPTSRLILVGRPGDGEVIEEPGVLHRLFVPHEELLDKVFAQSDVFVLPTGAEGSFAFTMFEAMSVGLPIITVDAWAMSEIVVQGENGYLIQPGSLADLVSCMRRLVDQPELLDRMIVNSQRIFRDRFSVAAHNLQLRSVYDRVLADSGPRTDRQGCSRKVSRRKVT